MDGEPQSLSNSSVNLINSLTELTSKLDLLQASE